MVVGDVTTHAQATNYMLLSLGYTLELEEKLAVREREALALWQELSQAKAKLTDAKKATTEEVRSAREVTMLEF
jgi:hypothetical protein